MKKELKDMIETFEIIQTGILLCPENLTQSNTLMNDRIMQLKGILYFWEDVSMYENCIEIQKRILQLEGELKKRNLYEQRKTKKN